MDMEGKYLFLSPSVKDTLGYEVDEMIGTITTDYIHPDDLPAIMSEMKTTIEGKVKTNQALFRFRHKEWRVSLG